MAADTVRPEFASHLITDIPIPHSSDEDLFDSECDPNNPVAIVYEDIVDAYDRIRSEIQTVQLAQYGCLFEIGFPTTHWQEQAKLGVIASSAGNHAQALAYHGRQLGIPVTVVMPVNAPLVKVESCINYGANVICKGNDMSEAKPYAMKVGRLNNIPYVNGYDHPRILQGQGTCGLEILEQVPNVEAIIVPVGGGGLIAGVAAAVKKFHSHVKVIGVESAACPAFRASMDVGELVHTPCKPSVADGLAVPLVGCNSLHTCKGLVDKMITVDEVHIYHTIVHLLEVEKCVVEGGGATALAALIAGLLPELEGKTVVPILSGGNIDTTVLGRVIERGLVFAGRLCRFIVVVADRPGSIGNLCTTLMDLGVSIKDIFHERTWIRSSIFEVQVRCICETRDRAHAAKLKATLEKQYNQVFWGQQTE